MRKKVIYEWIFWHYPFLRWAILIRYQTSQIQNSSPKEFSLKRLLKTEILKFWNSEIQVPSDVPLNLPFKIPICCILTLFFRMWPIFVVQCCRMTDKILQNNFCLASTIRQEIQSSNVTALFVTAKIQLPPSGSQLWTLDADLSCLMLP